MFALRVTIDGRAALERIIDHRAEHGITGTRHALGYPVDQSSTTVFEVVLAATGISKQGAAEVGR